MSASLPTPTGPQLFISFRRKNVRNDFISFLDHALREANINVSIDENELLGEDLADLLKRIEESEIALVIFSKDFTSSYWCLEQLAKIKERKDQGRLKVIPIFYKLKPSVVKNLEGDYGDHFRELTRKHLHQPERTQKWKEALESIPEYIGMPLAEQSDVTSREFINSLVLKIQKVVLKHMAVRENLEPELNRQTGSMVATRQPEREESHQGGSLVSTINVATQNGTKINGIDTPEDQSSKSTEKRKIKTQRVEAQGGSGGGPWDHGIKTGVRKILVGRDNSCVSYLKFEYFSSDGTVRSYAQGIQNQDPEEFVVDFPNEYITSVEGTYAREDYVRNIVITSLIFKTSTGRTSPRFGNHGFVLQNNGRKLVGFHGKAGNTLDAIGAHFEQDTSPSVRAPSRKLREQGGPGGGPWDDGVYSGVRKVYVGRDESCVTVVKFDYVNADGEEITREHGQVNQNPQEFLLDYPNEYITSVKGTQGLVFRYSNYVVTSLAFTTSKGRTSPTFGATKFVLEDNGRQLVGFHGRSGIVIDAIGAYFAPAPPPS